jgi:hypothetical protein
MQVPAVRIRVSPSRTELSIGDTVWSLQRTLEGMVRGKPQPDVLTYEREVITSAPADQLSGDGSIALRNLLSAVRDEHERLARQLKDAEAVHESRLTAYESWANGFLLKRMLKNAFRSREIAVDDARAELVRLRSCLQQIVVRPEIHVEQTISVVYTELCEKFKLVAAANRIWDTVSQERLNQIAQRTSSSHALNRREVRFVLAASNIFLPQLRVPHMENANGGSLYFYPGFVLYFESRETFAMLDVRDIVIGCGTTRFLEEEMPPADAEAVGSTWAKVNKDGSPDRRFRGNHPIPIFKYADLTFTTASGMNERYMISNRVACEEFAAALKRYQGCFTSQPTAG